MVGYKKGRNVKQFILGIVVALATMGVMAEISNTVRVTKFHQSYPYSSKATVEYTVGGALLEGAVAEITLNTDDASATFIQSNIVTGANAFMIDFASSFGGALLLTNASFVVTIVGAGHGGTEEDFGGVQLWEKGPYWAECNVGAFTPEEYGYYFWWGDTVGYKRENDAWVATDGSSSNFSFNFYNTPTCAKDIASLQSEGWIVWQNGAYVLVPAHDAAHVKWGGEWRMPTQQEENDLNINCDWTWTTKNGVNGYEVRGRGDYASNSIFLPCAGFGNGTSLSNAGSDGDYWSSVPLSDYYNGACYLYFTSSLLHFYYHERYFGRSVRPVRGFAQ